MKFSFKSAVKLTPEELAQCKKLTVPVRSQMKAELKLILADPELYVDSKVGLIKEGEIIGWSLYSRGDMFFFIKPKFRRKGLGRRLIRYMRRKCKGQVYAWNQTSKRFFETMAESKVISYNDIVYYV